jgi:CBS domain containing-hemolysin-like protein
MRDFFPVTDEIGHLVGMVKAKDACRVPESGRDLVYVMDIMIQKSDLIIMSTESSVDDVLKHLGNRRDGEVAFICDQEGKPTGLISKMDIKNAANERKHLRQSTSLVAGSKY